MNLRKLKIQKIRGIDSKEFTFDIHPNTPTFFVAPNGFGKTSIATAFNSLDRNKLKISDDDFYKNEESQEARIEITDEQGNIYVANNNTNTICENFSVCVINSQVKPKASVQNFGAFPSSKSSLVVEPIILYNNIPQKNELEYSFADTKLEVGSAAGKLLKNMNPHTSDLKFVKLLYITRNNFDKLYQARNQKKIEELLTELNTFTGTAQQISLATVNLAPVEEMEPICNISRTFDYLFDGLNSLEKIVNIIQLGIIYYKNKSELSKIIKYYEFLNDKKEINGLLSFFNCTWKNIKAVKKSNKFLIEFPKAHQISNGERDILCFIAKLFEARSILRKDRCILIIDEIFDYLDDANLISAQYFLTKFINDFKSSGKEIFPIILTHLDPMYFNTYSFSVKNCVYLNKQTFTSNKYKINNLLKDRKRNKQTDPELYNRVSSNYLHYNINNICETQYLSHLDVDNCIHAPIDFRSKAFEELQNYVEGKEYDLALVCCGLRLHVEKYAYERLAQNDRITFLGIYKTVDKLSFAKEKGVNVPEIYFLLSIIYNEAMHMDAQCQKLIPILCKLKNKVIHNMIAEAVRI